MRGAQAARATADNHDVARFAGLGARKHFAVALLVPLGEGLAVNQCAARGRRIALGFLGVLGRRGSFSVLAAKCRRLDAAGDDRLHQRAPREIGARLFQRRTILPDRPRTQAWSVHAPQSALLQRVRSLNR